MPDELLVRCSAASHAPRVAKIATYRRAGSSERPGSFEDTGLQPVNPGRRYPAGPADPVMVGGDDGQHWHVELVCPLCGLGFRAADGKLQPIVAQLIAGGVPEIELLRLRRLYS